MTSSTPPSDLSHLTALARRASLRETVADALRAAIISGEMVPGTVYSAPALGSRFGVSATPVREAMLDLVREGMVTSVPNKGFRVTEVSEADLDDITELRLLIEPPTVRRVTPVVPASGFARLRRLACDIIGFAAQGDLIAYTEADRLFHLGLLDYSGNPRLVDTVLSLRAQTRLRGLSALAESGELEDSAKEHLELLDRIEARDGRGAEALMRRHIGHVRGKWAGRPQPDPAPPTSAPTTAGPETAGPGTGPADRTDPAERPTDAPA